MNENGSWYMPGHYDGDGCVFPGPGSGGITQPIPQEFFDWALTQWWGIPAFIIIVSATIWGFAYLLEGATSK